MKRYLLLIAFISVSNFCLGQIHEAGFFVGGTNYIGDVGKTNYISPNNPGGSLVYKYNLNPRIALRANYSHFRIEGDDANSKNAIRQARGYSFNNSLNEFAAGIEYNFYEYDLSSSNKISTPYILLQLALVDFKAPEADQPLFEYLFTRKTSLSVPVGIGYKSKLYGKLAFAVETTFRYTFTDQLDYPNQPINDIGFTGNGNDWYVFTGVSLVYTFGRPACYADLRF